MSVLRERPIEMSDDSSVEKKVAEVLIRWVPDNQQVTIVVLRTVSFLPFFIFGGCCISLAIC